MKTITLNFNGIETTIQQNKDGLYRLNDLHKASGGEERHTPNQYARSLSDSQTAKMLFQKIKGGRYSGTYCNERGVYWYAAKISEEFEDAVFSCFEAAANGKGEEAVLSAQQVIRIQSKDIRKNECAAIKEYQINNDYYSTKLGNIHYGQLTNLTNSLLGIEKGNRDGLTAEQLANLIVVEKLTAKVILESKDLPYKELYNNVKEKVSTYLTFIS